ncbi:poly-gamma-glutamate hydrolase family protein [Mechercharimyces sp. CAU 1602]|uniref:poly-gamma-glutamate hydrolase family protein n=1 Tax=Mechercharimyces sp. CAU 1602 TaxID=2973933 RepID=UPI002161B025|nr:poly-gamma-glutamate hydrolase family protein [Mechercharimyces sp. CAU 1602]MCS1350215.1 poly-gamma-glutamate hydrolase family protein [Mechercharimyces sp. CAU 1602]
MKKFVLFSLFIFTFALGSGISYATNTYKDYLELTSQTEEGVDYSRSITERDVAVLAIHGGGIKPGTSEVAEGIAGENYSLYKFEGIRSSNNSELQIDTTHFNDPDALRLVSSAQKVISVLGSNGDEKIAYIGGRDTNLRDLIILHLTSAGFDARIASNSMANTSEDNIVNKGVKGAGVQIELTEGLRKSLFDDYTGSDDRSRTKNKHYVQFIQAVRSSIAGSTDVPALESEETIFSEATYPAQSKVTDLLNVADKYIGTRYKWGTGPYSRENPLFDCSSFTQQIYKEVGVTLLRNSREQSTQGKTIVSVPQPDQFVGDGTVKEKGERLKFNNIKAQLKKGDLIFFDNIEESPNLEKIHHVAIYINEYTLLHATEEYGANYTYFKDERKNNIVSVRRIFDEHLPVTSQSEIVQIGEKYLGTPHSKDGEEGTYSSKFIRDVFAEVDISLPNTAHDMSKVGIDLPKDQLQQGDLLYFDSDHDGVITHVAMYIDKDTLLHSTVSRGVTYTSFSSYWQDAWVKSKRILDINGSIPLNKEIYQTALSYLGEDQIEDVMPHDDGGNPIIITPNTAEFVQKVFHDHRTGVPRYTNDQRQLGKSISLEQAQPGDLIFFDFDDDQKSDYVAFYVDNDTILLSYSSSGVQYQSLDDERKDDILQIQRISQ